LAPSGAVQPLVEPLLPSAAVSASSGYRTAEKTIFMVVHQGFVARFLLRTEVLTALRDAGTRIVVLTPNHKEPYLRDEFRESGVALEPLRASISVVMRSRLWLLLYYLRSYTLGAVAATPALQQKYAGARGQQRSKNRAVDLLIHAALQVLWRSGMARRALLSLESLLFSPRLHRDLFERYRPDLVVATSPGWFVADALLLREARRSGVATAVAVLSWDNPTSKGYRGARPERIIAWSERMADQVASHHDYPRDRVEVCGVPHFDPYRRDGVLWSREELCSRLGLDPTRRLVVFATSSPGHHSHNLEVADAVAREVADGSLGAPAQLVVRVHPIYFRPDHLTPIDGFRELTQRHPHVLLDIPEVLSDRLRCDVPGSDNLRLGSLLKNCDVLVNVFSTTTLEAFLLDKPVVLVSPSGHAFAEYAHIRPVAEGNAALIADTPAAVVAHIRTYLREPALHSEERRRLALEECGPSDGMAGERIARRLLKQMGTVVPPEWPPSPGVQEFSVPTS
jgi:hypothetical protein